MTVRTGILGYEEIFTVAPPNALQGGGLSICTIWRVTDNSSPLNDPKNMLHNKAASLPDK
jgi:hypothetical protein